MKLTSIHLSSKYIIAEMKFLNIYSGESFRIRRGSETRICNVTVAIQFVYGWNCEREVKASFGNVGELYTDDI